MSLWNQSGQLATPSTDPIEALKLQMSQLTALHTAGALDEYLDGRHYDRLFSWPEQGLEVYQVGAK